MSAPAIMQSALYQGWVGHCRTAPVCNAFRYRLFFLYLDLSELDTVFADRWFWSVERPNWASFRRTDHLRRPGPLEQAARDEVEKQLGFRPTGPVRLLTHLRYLGYCFNPISIYYCFDLDCAQPEAILVEVHNTPWGEEYLQALDTRGATDNEGCYRYQLGKEFHVSPFMPMDIDYQWVFSAPGESLRTRMESYRQGEQIFSAWFSLQRRDVSGANLTRALLHWPCMTGKVIAAIYWQALRLKSKVVPFCPHPEQMQISRGSYYR